MSTATATADEQLVSQPGRTIIFLARRSALRLTKTPRYPLYGASGQKVGEKPGEVIPFSDGRFDCPLEGTVILEDGREADAADVLKFLENHRLIGDIEEGFWRVDPTAPPPSREELEALQDAALRLDDELLRKLIEQERQGWQREDILSIAEGTLERIIAVKEQARADAEAEQPAPKPAAKKKPQG